MNTKKLKPGNYKLLNYNYIALVDSFGTCCDNCGRLISNIATIADDDNHQYTVGLDCAKTILSKESYSEAKAGISLRKKAFEKIKMLEKAQKPYVLNNSGWPCYPPETRHGYMIQY